MSTVLDPMLRSAYERTRYRAVTPCGPVEIRISRGCPGLDRLLAMLGARCWVFVSACNPGSELLPENDNSVMHARLLHRLEKEGAVFFPGSGMPDASDWPAEASVLILGMTRKQGRALGRWLGQVAVVCGEMGRPAELVYCGDDHKRRGGRGL